MNQLVITLLKFALAAYVAVKLVVVAILGLFFGALIRRLYRTRAVRRSPLGAPVTRRRKRVRTASVID